MKYGLITFKYTENIGDDIQSYAAMRFLPKVDYYIEREKLDLFLPKKKEQVVTIMNGWFLHSKINFPISPYIYPIFVSTHFSAYNSGGIGTEYINSYTKKTLTEYGPIGCRDLSTVDLLDKNNIDNYFSGCLTLTIQKDNRIKKKTDICIVDIDDSAENYLREKFKNIKIIKRTHVLDKEKNSRLDYKKRFENVKSLLDTYQESKLVVTSRLHCALPCLALGTPVILLYDENKLYTKDRLKDYAEILTHMSTEEFLLHGEETIKNGVTNPNKYLKIRSKIKFIVKDKLDNCKVESKVLPSIDDYKKLYVIPKKNIDFLYNIAVSNMDTRKREYINLQYEKNYWKKEFNNAVLQKDKCMEENKNLCLKLNELQEQLNIIKNSKGYKILEKIRKFKNNK